MVQWDRCHADGVDDPPKVQRITPAGRRCGDIVETDCRNHNRDVYRFDPETTRRVEACMKSCARLGRLSLSHPRTSGSSKPNTEACRGAMDTTHTALQLETKARSQYNRVVRVSRHIAWYGSLPD